MVVLATLLVALVNLKLIDLVRDITSGGQLRVLRPEAFWFKSPQNLLQAIRMAVFMVAFSLGSLVFMA